MIVVRGGTTKPISSQKLAAYFETRTDLEGYLYIGYPMIGTVDGGYSIDALLLSQQHGAIIFHLIEGAYDENIKIVEIQDENYTKLESKLKLHKDLTTGRNLAIALNVATFAPAWVNRAKPHSDYPILVVDADLANYLEHKTTQSQSGYQKLVSVIQSITTIRNRTKREYVKKLDSRGAKLKRLEDSIANLDRQQSHAVIETVDGVQRIRGLAGSGKTIVLALKVAYLHAKNPDWKIAVTFNSRSLKNQFKHFISLFTFEHLNQEPNWNKIDIIHAWGNPTNSIPGIYYNICLIHNIEFLDFGMARSHATGYGKEFNYVCEKAYNEIKDYQQYYDAILIDEAQDFSPHFLRLCYGILKEPKRLVYAYDELQNLNNNQMPSPEELFGIGANHSSLISLPSDVNEKAKQDIVLDVCYRNSRPLLATAHALGFGIYRIQGLIQLFEQPQLWKDVGYKVKNGKLADGELVTLMRDAQSSPTFLENHSSLDDLIIVNSFDTDDAQIAYLITELEKNITDDELNSDDIMVIHQEPYATKGVVGKVRAALFKKGINSELAGVTTTDYEFSKKDSVVFTQVHRAKGNEAAMVYIINAQEYFSGDNLVQHRNKLFTAITRSKAWVRILGYGQDMQALKNEFEQLKTHNFELNFTYPNAEERKKLNLVDSDRSKQEQNKLKKKAYLAIDLLKGLQNGDIRREDLDKNVRKELIKKLGGKYA